MSEDALLASIGILAGLITAGFIWLFSELDDLGRVPPPPKHVAGIDPVEEWDK